MNKHPLLPFLLEMAATGVMLYVSINPEINLAAGFYLILMKVSRGIAEIAGTIGMRAEVRYYQTVKL